MADWAMNLLAWVDFFCIIALFLHCRKLQDESDWERMRLRDAMDYALSIDTILTDATMPEDKRKELQDRFHIYLAAIGFCSMNMPIEWDWVAKCRADMDEVLDQSGWEWKVDDQP